MSPLTAWSRQWTTDSFTQYTLSPSFSVAVRVQTGDLTDHGGFQDQIQQFMTVQPDLIRAVCMPDHFDEIDIQTYTGGNSVQLLRRSSVAKWQPLAEQIMTYHGLMETHPPQVIDSMLDHIMSGDSRRVEFAQRQLMHMVAATYHDNDNAPAKTVGGLVRQVAASFKVDVVTWDRTVRADTLETNARIASQQSARGKRKRGAPESYTLFGLSDPSNSSTRPQIAPLGDPDGANFGPNWQRMPPIGHKQKEANTIPIAVDQSSHPIPTPPILHQGKVRACPNQIGLSDSS